jgi:calnexin
MNTILIVSAVLLLSTVWANEYSNELPTPNDKVVFFEHFNTPNSDWVASENEKFSGIFKVRESVGANAVSGGDKGLAVESQARHHGISVPFKNAVNNEGKDFFFQYEVKFENGLECGGAYIKLLTKEFMPKDLANFDNDTPYTIMFGPDKCGNNNKVHFIFRHKNPITGAYEEKHLDNPPHIAGDKLTHLYTLHVTPDNQFSISIDGEMVKEGSLLEDFNPSVNPPKEVDDPNDIKPATWVDEEFIPDPEDKKPDDWDEDAPATIVDESAEMPEDWLENEPEYIPDPSQQKPDDWDDELDGDFIPIDVPNPKCFEVGCGKWEKPRIPNPGYKGKWQPEMIDNPDYKGPWKARQIPNPNYYEDKNPYKFDAIGGIGIELWTMQDGIIFDNIVVSYDSGFINKLKTAWSKKSAEENRLKQLSEGSTGESVLDTVNQFIEQAVNFAKDEKNFWVVVGSGVVGIVIPLLMCVLRPKKKVTTTVSEGSKKKEGKKDGKKEKKLKYEEAGDDKK